MNNKCYNENNTKSRKGWKFDCECLQLLQTISLQILLLVIFLYYLRNVQGYLGTLKLEKKKKSEK